MKKENAHASKQLYTLLSGLLKRKVRPDDVESFRGIIFGEIFVERWLPHGSKVRVKAFVGYSETGDALIWSADQYRPVAGKAYTVFAAKAFLRRASREFQEVPVFPDATLLGLEERIQEGTLTVETTLVMAKEQDGTEALYGFGPNGKIVRAMDGANLPVGQKLTFAVRSAKMIFLEAFTVVQGEAVSSDNQFVVAVKGSLHHWPEKFGLTEEEIVTLTLERLENVISMRLESVKGAFDRACRVKREALDGKDSRAEEAMKHKDFPNLVILEECAKAAREWFVANKERIEGMRASRNGPPPPPAPETAPTSDAKSQDKATKGGGRTNRAPRKGQSKADPSPEDDKDQPSDTK